VNRVLNLTAIVLGDVDFMFRVSNFGAVTGLRAILDKFSLHMAIFELLVKILTLALDSLTLITL